MRPLLIGITGGSASGKTTIAKEISKMLPNSLIFSMDCFYSDLPIGQDPKHYNFDHPNALDFEKCQHALTDLMHWNPTSIPIYDFSLNKAVGTEIIQPSSIIIIEGIFALYINAIREMMDMKIYVHADDDVRLARRLQRDIVERGRTIEGGLSQYNRFVKPCQQLFITPMMKYSDIIIPNDKDNHIAIDIIFQSIKSKMISMMDAQIEGNLPNNSLVLSKSVGSSDQKVLNSLYLKFLSQCDNGLLGVYSDYVVKKLKRFVGKPENMMCLKELDRNTINANKLNDDKNVVICVPYLTSEYAKILLECIPSEADQARIKIACVFMEEEAKDTLKPLELCTVYTVSKQIQLDVQVKNELMKSLGKLSQK